MKLAIQLTSLIVLLAIVVSCNKDSDEADSKTKTELLTAAPWKLIAATINPAYNYYGDGNATTNIHGILKACEKDDFEVYKTNVTVEYNEGPTKCDPSSPQIFSLPWSFTNNETKMLVDGVEHTIL
jgi:hypothetical protein